MKMGLLTTMRVGLFLRMLAGLAFAVAGPASVEAQRVKRPASSKPVCADSTTAPYRDRLAMELEYEGADRREMWSAIEIAIATAGICVVPPAALPTPDTSIILVFRFVTGSAGGLELATDLRGARAGHATVHSPCRSPRALVGRKDLVFAVLLTRAAERAARCALEARGSTSPPPARDGAS